jgi:hypothetical protein
MVDKACRKCGWYDPDYECVCPPSEPWQCRLDKEAIEELNKACEEWQRRAEDGN